MAIKDNPLTKADLANIKRALYLLSERQPLVELLKKAGVDTSEQDAKVEYYTRVLSTFRNELFPGVA